MSLQCFIMLFKCRHFVDQRLDLAIQLVCTESKVKNVLMLAAADHALLELGAILSNNLFHAQFLKLDGDCKVQHDDFVTAKISHCFLQQVVLSAYLHHIVNKCCLGFLDPSLDALCKRAVRHVRQYQKVLSYVFLFEEFIANCCSLLRVDNQELEALFEGDFDSDVVLAINWFD